MARGLQRGDVAARAAADVERRALDALEQLARRRRRPGPSQRASGSGSTWPSARRSAALVRRPAAGGVLRRGGQQAAVEQVGAQRPRLVGRGSARASESPPVTRPGPRARSPPSAAAKRPSGRLGGDRARVLDRVDVAQRRQDRRPQAEDRQPRALDGARVVLAHRDALEHPRVGLAQADRPVAAVERGAERRVAARDARRARPPAAPGVTCGVSMPTRKAGPPTSANAAASRSARPSPRCGTISKPPGIHGPGSPSSTTTRRTSRSTASAAASVSSIAARRQPRRLLGRAGRGQARLHAPGDGRLGDDHEGGGHGVYARQARIRFTARTAAMSRTARTVPRTRAGDLRAALAGQVAHRDLLEPPARGGRAQDHLQRPAEAAVADAEREQRLAARGAHRPEVGHAHAGAAAQLEREHARWRPARAAARRRRARRGGRRARGRRSRPRPGRRRARARAGRTTRRSP